MSEPSVTELDEEAITNAVVLTPHGYEWVIGLVGQCVDGRALVPHVNQEGELEEMVSVMGEYYRLHVESLLEDTLEVLGFADDRTEAAELARAHYVENR